MKVKSVKFERAEMLGKFIPRSKYSCTDENVPPVVNMSPYAGLLYNKSS